MNTKTLWQSKTFWVNLIAALSFLLQKETGTMIDPDLQGLLLAGANIILRMITKKPVRIR